MANLSLLDAFGLDASGSLRPGARLAEALPQFFSFQKVSLDQVQLATAQGELALKQPIALSAPGLTLTVGAGTGGLLRIRTAADHFLDSDDPLDLMTIDTNEIYIELSLLVSVTGGVGLAASLFAFGFSAEKELELSLYRRFRRGESGFFPLFGEALARTFQSFVIPQSRADLESLDRDTVVVMRGTGELKFSTSFGIETPVRQLAATSPIAGNMVAVNASGSFNLTLGATLSGGYQSRLRKLDSGAVELGIYTIRSRTLAVQVSAQAGISAAVDRFDLAEKFISALSCQPIVDLQEFQQAIPGEDVAARDLQIATFQHNLQAAISTTVAASLTAGLSNLRSNESAFTFEVDLDATTSEAAISAVDAALHGDFDALTRPGSSLPTGIKQTSNVFTHTDLAKHKLAINLLGIVNFLSVAKLARVSTVQRNANGEITLISDAADLNILQALLLNAAGNAKRLRSMLSEDFLVQATFKVVDLRVLPPEYSAQHTFFEINESTGKQRMKDLLDVCRATGLMTSDQEDARLQVGKDFGRTTFWLQTAYSGTALEHTLLTASGSARTQADFEIQGRLALAGLLAGDEGQEFRKLIADLGPRGTSIWTGMKQNGNVAAFNTPFGLPLDVHDPRVSAAASDFICITSWAASMNQLAEAVIEVRTLLKSAVRPDDDRLTALRNTLRDRIAGVVKHSGEHFGDPIGLVMVFLSSKQSAGVSVLATGPSIQTLRGTIPPSAPPDAQATVAR